MKNLRSNRREEANGLVAQVVEQQTENLRVGGANPLVSTKLQNQNLKKVIKKIYTIK